VRQVLSNGSGPLDVLEELVESLDQLETLWLSFKVWIAILNS
jgi:hypothetical protein